MSNSLLLATVHLLSEQKAHMVYRMLCVTVTSTGLRVSDIQMPLGLSQGWQGMREGGSHACGDPQRH